MRLIALDASDAREVSVNGEETLLGFSGQPRSDKNHFSSVLFWTPQYSANFCPIFRVKGNVCPRLSTLTYPRKIFDELPLRR